MDKKICNNIFERSKTNGTKLHSLNRNFSWSKHITTEEIRMILNFPGHSKLLIIDYNPDLRMISSATVSLKPI